MQSESPPPPPFGEQRPPKKLHSGPPTNAGEYDEVSSLSSASAADDEEEEDEEVSSSTNRRDAAAATAGSSPLSASRAAAGAAGGGGGGVANNHQDHYSIREYYDFDMYCDGQLVLINPKEERTKRELGMLEYEQRKQLYDEMGCNQLGLNGNIHQLHHDEDRTFMLLQQIALEVELQKISNTLPEKQAFLLALQQNRTYVNEENFRKRFLRADRYDPIAASKRIIGHFHYKRQLFGDANGILGRDVTIDDLSSYEQAMLGDSTDDTTMHTNTTYEYKPFRFLRHPDYAGRRVFFTRPGKVDFANLQSTHRAMWVLINSMVANNDEVQRLGCVHLVHMLDDMPTKINFFDTLRYGNQLLRYNPIRFEATFTLVQGTNATDSPWKNVIDFMNYICGRNLRLRSRVIYGPIQECRYRLYCLGFTEYNIPEELMEGSRRQQLRQHQQEHQHQRRILPMLVEDDDSSQDYGDYDEAM